MSLPVLYASVDAGAPAMSRLDALPAPPAAKGPPITRLIVKYRDAALKNVAAQNGALGQPLLDRLSSLAGQPVASERAMSGGAFVVRLLQSLPADQAESLTRYLATDPSIEYAAPDRLKQPKKIPNDPDYPQQWHYQSPPGEPGGVNLPPAWDITTGSAAIVVAVIDTGSLPLHPDLAGRYVGGYDMISDARIANDGDGREADASDPGDWITQAESLSGFFAGCPQGSSSWHGTHVAGTIGAASNNGIGVAGINWVSRILPVRALGKCGGFDSDIIDAMVWAVGGAVPGAPANPNPARVLNLSIGGSGTCGPFQNAVDTALGAGAVVVIAAGNENQDASLSSPGNCDGVITVAAIGRQGQRAAYSNFGTLVEIAAPGGDFSDSGVLSTLNAGATFPRGYTYANYYGTSMATPHVAGIASLMLSANPSLTPAQVLAVIQNTARAFPNQTARNCTTSLCGAGIIDAGAAVASIVLPRTTTLLGSGANPANAATSVSLTATVSGAAPSGSVNFSEGGSALAGCSALPLTGSGNVRTALCNSTTLSVGTHAIVASYGGDPGNTGSNSSALLQVIDTASGGVNVAAAAAGGVASASSVFSSAYPVKASNDNDRKGAAWGNGGGWNDATANAFPDWLQIDFNGSKTIDRIIVYTLQDNYPNPIEPTDSLTFTQYGVTDFAVQGWNGAAWVTLSSVSGNNLVKRAVTFSPFTTSRIRINVTNAPVLYSRLVEVEAWGMAVVGPPATTTLASSLNPSTTGASVTFTATVTGSNPTGSVAFTDAGNALAGCSAVALAGSGNARTAPCPTSALTLGTHSIVAAYAGDAGNAASSSSPLSQVVNAGGSSNVALTSNGAVASASSTYSAAFPVAAIIDNERAGVNWGNGGGWNDATANAYPDWVQINFNLSKTINRVVVYTLQDNYTHPVEPTDSMTFSLYGITAFTVQGRQGSKWINLGSVTGNNLVKRSVTFSPFTTTSIRVRTTSALASFSRITEVEAWGD